MSTAWCLALAWLAFGRVRGSVNIISLQPTYVDTFHPDTNNFTTDRFDELTLTCLGGDTANLQGIGADGVQYNVSVTCPPLTYTYQLEKVTYVPNDTNVVINQVCQTSAAPNVFQSSGGNQAQLDESVSSMSVEAISDRVSARQLPPPDSPYYRSLVTFQTADGSPCAPGLKHSPADCAPYVERTPILSAKAITYQFPNGTTCNPSTDGATCQARSTPIANATYQFAGTTTNCNPMTDGATCVLVGIQQNYNTNYTAPAIATIQDGQCVKAGSNTDCPRVNGACPVGCFEIAKPIDYSNAAGSDAPTYSVPLACNIAAGTTAAAAFSFIPFLPNAALLSSGISQGFCYSQLTDNINNVASTVNKNLNNVVDKLNGFVASTNTMLQNINTFVQTTNQLFQVYESKFDNLQAQLNVGAQATAQLFAFMQNQNNINFGVQGQVSALNLFSQQVSAQLVTLNSTLNNFIDATQDNFAQSRAYDMLLQSEITQVYLASEENLRKVQTQMIRTQIVDGVRLQQLTTQIQNVINLIQQHIQQLYTNFNVQYEIVNGLYQSVQQTYSFLFDISAIIKQYHLTLKAIKNEGIWKPMLLTEGSPLAKDSQWNIIGTRKIQATTLIDCKPDQSQSVDPNAQAVIDDFYSGYPLTVVQSSGSTSTSISGACSQFNSNQNACLSSVRRCSYIQCQFAPANSAQCIPTFSNASLYNTPYDETQTLSDGQTYTQVNGTALFRDSRCVNTGSATPLSVQVNTQPRFIGCFEPVATGSLSSLGTIALTTASTGPFNATGCIAKCSTTNQRFASVISDQQGYNYCICSLESPGLTQVDVVSGCSVPCYNSTDSTQRTCGGTNALSVYRTAREDFRRQTLCVSYGTQEDCITDARCGFIRVGNQQGFCIESSDPVYVELCSGSNQQVYCQAAVQGLPYGSYSYQNLVQTRYALASLPAYSLQNDTTLQANSLTYQDLTNGFYVCPGGLIDIPGNKTHCCYEPVVAATGQCRRGVRNPSSPQDLWRARVASGCSGQNGPRTVSINILLGCINNASDLTPGQYACVPLIDEPSLQNLGFNTTAIPSWNGSIIQDGQSTRIKQLQRSITENTTLGNPLYYIFGRGNLANDVGPVSLFFDGYSPSFSLYNYSFERWYGYNASFTTADGSGMLTSSDAWDRHQSINSFTSNLLAQDLVTYENVMRTFYGSNPITWGASFGQPVLQSQSPPTYVNNVRTTKCNYANFGVYRPFFIPVWQLRDLSQLNYGTACSASIQINGVTVEQDSCIFSDLAQVNRPKDEDYLVFGKDPSGQVVYSPPSTLLRPFQNEAGRRGSLTYVHTYGQPTLNFADFYNRNQQFDPQYLDASIGLYSAPIDNSTDPFCGNETAIKQGYGTSRGGLCLLSKSYQIGITTPQDGNLPKGALYDPTSLIMYLYSRYAPMQFTVKVPFAEVGLRMSAGCAASYVVQCDPSTQLLCTVAVTNDKDFTLNQALLVVYNGTQGIADGTVCANNPITVKGASTGTFAFQNCAGNTTLTVSGSCFSQNLRASSLQNFFGNDSASQILAASTTISTLQLQFATLTSQIVAANYPSQATYIQSTAKTSLALSPILGQLSNLINKGVLQNNDGLLLNLNNVSQQLAATSYITSQYANLGSLNDTLKLLNDSLPTLNASIVQQGSAVNQALINYQTSVNALQLQYDSITAYSSNLTQQLAATAAVIAMNALSVNYTSVELQKAIRAYLSSSGGSIPISAFPTVYLILMIISFILSFFAFCIAFAVGYRLQRFFQVRNDDIETRALLGSNVVSATDETPGTLPSTMPSIRIQDQFYSTYGRNTDQRSFEAVTPVIDITRGYND